MHECAAVASVLSTLSLSLRLKGETHTYTRIGFVASHISQKVYCIFSTLSWDASVSQPHHERISRA